MAEWAASVAVVRQRLATNRKRLFTPGTVRTCPSCGRKMLASRDDLTREVTAGAVAVVHHHLHGARCGNCGSEFLEAYEQVALDESGIGPALSDYQANVTNVSGRNLGTYWPKDIVRVMKLRPKDALRVQVLDEDTMIVKRHRDLQ